MIYYGDTIKCDDAGRGKDRITGATKEAKGTVKDAIGRATGDDNLQAEGKADKAQGKVQSAISGVMDAVRNALKI
jgi:uncharacterized protein YjbJ (UPF0337 family)